MKLPLWFTAFKLFVLSISSANAADKPVVVGDSHTAGFFGEELAKLSIAQRYAVAGSASIHWKQKYICPAGKRCPFTYGYATPRGSFNGPVPSSFPGIAGVLAAERPSTIIVALGTNDAMAGCKSANGANAARDIAAYAAQGRKCFWVGPPTYTRGPLINNCGVQRYNAFVESLRVAVSGSCTFIDSRKVLNPATGKPIEADRSDQLHFNAGLGKIWARAVAGQLGL